MIIWPPLRTAINLALGAASAIEADRHGIFNFQAFVLGLEKDLLEQRDTLSILSWLCLAAAGVILLRSRQYAKAALWSACALSWLATAFAIGNEIEKTYLFGATREYIFVVTMRSSPIFPLGLAAFVFGLSQRGNDAAGIAPIKAEADMGRRPIWVTLFCCYLLLSLQATQQVFWPDHIWHDGPAQWSGVRLDFAKASATIALILYFVPRRASVTLTLAFLWFWVIAQVMILLTNPPLTIYGLGDLAESFGFGPLATIAWTAYFKTDPMIRHRYPGIRRKRHWEPNRQGITLENLPHRHETQATDPPRGPWRNADSSPASF